jgi:hypothetical protein
LYDGRKILVPFFSFYNVTPLESDVLPVARSGAVGQKATEVIGSFSVTDFISNSGVVY